VTYIARISRRRLHGERERKTRLCGLCTPLRGAGAEQGGGERLKPNAFGFLTLMEAENVPYYLYSANALC